MENRHEMSHEVPFEDLVDLVEGRLSPGQADAFEAHINACAACTADVAWLRRVVALMATDRLVDAPREVVLRAQRLYRAPQRRPLEGLFSLWRGLWAPQVRRAGAVALTALLLIGALWVWGAMPVAQAATLSVVSGQVEVLQPGSSEWQPATPGLRIEPGSTLRVGAGATAVVQYADGSRTTLAEGTQVRILAIEGRRDGRTSSVRLSQQAGHTRHEVATARSSIQVETAGAVAEASEASYDVWVEGEETEVAAGKGQVAVSAGHSKANLAAGEHGRAAEGEVKVVPPKPAPARSDGHRQSPLPVPQPTDPPTPTPEPAKPGHGQDRAPTPEARPNPGQGQQAKGAPGPGTPPQHLRSAPKAQRVWVWPWARPGKAATPGD